MTLGLTYADRARQADSLVDGANKAQREGDWNRAARFLRLATSMYLSLGAVEAAQAADYRATRLEYKV